MNSESPLVAIVCAGGVGSRFGVERPKQLTHLAGQPVMQHTLQRMDDFRCFEKIVVAANPDWFSDIDTIVRRSVFSAACELVDGGATRNESIISALDAFGELSEARVLVHDSVRPLISRTLVERVAGELYAHRSVLPYIPSADLLVRRVGDHAGDFVSRSEIVQGQAPQGFWLSDLREAGKRFTDDASARGFSTMFELLRAVQPSLEIKLVPGDFENLKMTTPVDRMLAGRLLLEDNP